MTCDGVNVCFIYFPSNRSSYATSPVIHPNCIYRLLLILWYKELNLFWVYVTLYLWYQGSHSFLSSVSKKFILAGLNNDLKGSGSLSSVSEEVLLCMASGLRHCNKNRKVTGSKPSRRSAGLWDPTSLWGSRWPSGQICIRRSDYHWVNEAVPSRMAQSWPWDSQIAVKKKKKIYSFEKNSLWIYVKKILQLLMM